MAQRENAAKRLTSKVIGWRAARIDDPVDRLRFLRKSVGDRSPMTLARPETRRFLRDNRWKIAGVLTIALAWPAMEATRGTVRLLASDGVIGASSGSGGGETFPNVWLQEQDSRSETWSNGLRVEKKFETDNEPRRFEAYARGKEDQAAPVQLEAPAGIVYHTTESHLAPLEEGQSRRLRIIGHSLLQYVQEKRSYHFLIDRFGRVWRVVKEKDAANHAGYSVWADQRFTYVNLNRGFLGVSVETQTESGAGKAQVTPAQIHALKVLTEMLRSRYRIAEANCVTHAQVSVNPSNLQVGYHYDWAARFPYAEIGLPDNYDVPVPGMWIFGFTYDPSLVNVTGEKYWKGLLKGEERMRQDATASGAPPAQYRKALERRYRKILERVKTLAEPSAETQEVRTKESEG